MWSVQIPTWSIARKNFTILCCAHLHCSIPSQGLQFYQGFLFLCDYYSWRWGYRNKKKILNLRWFPQRWLLRLHFLFRFKNKIDNCTKCSAGEKKMNGFDWALTTWRNKISKNMIQEWKKNLRLERCSCYTVPWDFLRRSVRTVYSWRPCSSPWAAYRTATTK